MVVAYLGGGVDDERIKPIASIIERRLWALAPSAQAPQPMACAVQRALSAWDTTTLKTKGDGMLSEAMESLRAEFDASLQAPEGAERYRQANPLGGPAKVFRAMADAIEAGDSYEATLRSFCYAEAKPAPAEGDEPETYTVDAVAWESFLNEYERYAAGDPKLPFSAIREGLSAVISSAEPNVQPKGTCRVRTAGQSCDCPVATCDLGRGGLRPADAPALAQKLREAHDKSLDDRHQVCRSMLLKVIAELEAAPTQAPAPAQSAVAWLQENPWGGDPLLWLGHALTPKSRDAAEPHGVKFRPLVYGDVQAPAVTHAVSVADDRAFQMVCAALDSILSEPDRTLLQRPERHRYAREAMAALTAPPVLDATSQPPVQPMGGA